MNTAKTKRRGRPAKLTRFTQLSMLRRQHDAWARVARDHGIAMCDLIRRSVDYVTSDAGRLAETLAMPRAGVRLYTRGGS